MSDSLETHREYYSPWNFSYLLRKCNINYSMRFFSSFRVLEWPLACVPAPAYIMFEIHDDDNDPEGQGALCSSARSTCPNFSWQKRRSAIVLFFVATQSGVHYRMVSGWPLDRWFPDRITRLYKKALKIQSFWSWEVNHPLQMISSSLQVKKRE